VFISMASFNFSSSRTVAAKWNTTCTSFIRSLRSWSVRPKLGKHTSPFSGITLLKRWDFSFWILWNSYKNINNYISLMSCVHTHSRARAHISHWHLISSYIIVLRISHLSKTDLWIDFYSYVQSSLHHTVQLNLSL